jgi:hypothetical protein
MRGDTSVIPVEIGLLNQRVTAGQKMADLSSNGSYRVVSCGYGGLFPCVTGNGHFTFGPDRQGNGLDWITKSGPRHFSIARSGHAGEVKP